jgi:hypothetical protein
MHEAGNDTAGAASQATGGATWMTYREIAAARGITHAAAIRLVQRHRWQKREGSNDGLAHVLVPHDAVQPTPPVRRPRHTDPASPSHLPQTSPVTPNAATDARLLANTFETALAAIEAAHARELATLREQADAAERARTAAQAHSDQALATVADLTARSDAAIAAERQRADDLRQQIDVLNAEMVVIRAEADRALAEERLRADRLSEQVDAGHRDLDAVRADADARRTTIDELKAGQTLMTDMHARELTAAQDRLERVRDAAEAIRQADAARKARGLVARLRAAWRGE